MLDPALAYQLALAAGGAVAPTPTGNGPADTAAIQSLLNTGASAVLLRKGTYKITSTLRPLSGQTIAGAGGGTRATTLQKAFDGTFVEMADLSGLRELNLDCQGATFAGTGVHVGTGSHQRFYDVRVGNSKGIGLLVEGDQGQGLMCTSFEANTIDNLTVAAIRAGNDTLALSGGATGSAMPRFFTNIFLSGGFADFSAADDTYLAQSFLRNMVTDQYGAQLYIANTRFALVGDTITIKGSGGRIVGSHFAGPVVFTQAQDWVVLGGFNYGVAIDYATLNAVTGSACRNFMLTVLPFQWINASGNTTTGHAESDASAAAAGIASIGVPAWFQTTGTAPAWGNTTAEAGVSVNGSVAAIRLKITWGSTATFGNATTAWRFKLPFKTQQLFGQLFPAAAIVRYAGANHYADVSIAADDDNFKIVNMPDGGDLRSGYGIAAGDTLTVGFSYAVR